MKNKLNVLIVEDDENDSKALAAEVKANADKLCLAGELKSSNAALAFIRTHKPHAVILDLELQEGYGDGMSLLDEIITTLVYPKPYIVVNTNSASKIIIKSAKMKGADYVFAKWQKGYTPQSVINHLLSVMPAILGSEEEPPAPLTEQQLENKMRKFLQERFNKLGVSVKNEGYDYLVDAVILAAKGENQNFGKIIGDKIGKTKDAVTKAMQYAIDNAWKFGDTNNLEENYTAPVYKDKGGPTVIAFVLHYKQELINYINQ